MNAPVQGGAAADNLPGVDDVILEAEALENAGAGGGSPGELPGDNAGGGLDTEAMLAGLLAPLFLVVTPAWNVTDKECKALAGAWSPVLDKYCPGLDLGVELSAILVTVGILGSRFGKPMKQPAIDMVRSADEHQGQ